jgi:hypothetical protein
MVVMKKWITLFLLMTYLLQPAFCQEEEPTLEEAWDNYIYYLADTLEKSFAAADPALINSLFDKEYFINRIVIDKNDKKIKAFNDGFKGSLMQNFSLGSMMINSTKDHYYDFVNHFTSTEGTTHLIYRLMHSDGAFNYHNYEMQWRDSTLNIVDVYIYQSGENLSESLQILYKNGLREELDQDDKIFGKNDMYNSTEELNKVRQLAIAGKAKEAMESFLKIPEKYRKQKIFRILKMQVAQELGTEVYIQAVTEYVEQFPDDPSFYLMAYDKAIVDGNYDLAFKYIDKIDISVGLDPFLDFYRGNIYFYKKEYGKARKKYELIDKDYNFGTLDDLLFEVYYEMKDYKNVMMIMDRYLVNYEYTKKEIIEIVEKSNVGIFSIPELKDWKEKE